MTITSRAATADRSWTAQGVCRELDPDGFFVQGADQRKAAVMCEGCPVRRQCLADALDNRIEFGVWGGTTERERRRLLREHPRVEDWSQMLEHPEAAQDAMPLRRRVRRSAATGDRACGAARQ